MSIQLALDGHSFSAPALDGEFPGDVPVEVELLTPRTMLVPAEVFDTGIAAGLLAANGMAPADGECTVWSDPQQEIIAVMAVNNEAKRMVDEKLGTRARYTTPLLHWLSAAVPTVWMRHTAGLLYIKVWEGKLRFAGVFPAQEEADILYCFERLGSEFKLGGYELQIARDNYKRLRKLLNVYFKQIACE
ncbi:hypothetical protein [uncultured Alistipes sp.]|uniref:hypothetical protein n=1 Tax=uncultured Alistipes sp. TaxID=538949 RepID=UPI0025E7C71B|nr:hypothetical protein [uncultured Alistipes sp.]